MNRFLLDTNILLRLAVPEHPLNSVAKEAVRRLRINGHTAVHVPQILYEFWAVATRTIAANGLGLSATRVNTLIDDLISTISVLADDEDVFATWRLLAKTYSVSGVNSHDM